MTFEVVGDEKRTISLGDIRESWLIKVAIVAWVVSKSADESGDGKGAGAWLVHAEPIVVTHDDYSQGAESTRVESGSDLVTMVPAAPGSVRVQGFVPSEDHEGSFPGTGEFQVIGYEIPGISHPEWTAKLKDEIEARLSRTGAVS